MEGEGRIRRTMLVGARREHEFAGIDGGAVDDPVSSCHGAAHGQRPSFRDRRQADVFKVVFFITVGETEIRGAEYQGPVLVDGDRKIHPGR